MCSETTERLLVDFNDTEELSGLNIDVSLETPLHAKRRRRLLDPLASDPSFKVKPEYQTGGSSQNTPKPSIQEITSRQQQVQDEVVNYGSEDDSDEDVDEEDLFFPVVVPRSKRLLFEDQEEDPPSIPAQTSSLTSSLPVRPHDMFDSESPVRPYDMFDFEWRDFPDPQIPPAHRREVFSDHDCGPTSHFLTPYDAFIAIWSQDLIKRIVSETNKYADQIAERQYLEGTLGPNSRIINWRETNIDELYIYFALLLATGLCIKGDLKEYWAGDDLLATPNFSKYMSFNRFSLLSRCLHFADNKTVLKTMPRPKAKLLKIAPVVDHLNSKFESLYKLSRNIAIDSSLTQWKGWLNIKQFIKNKVSSVGIKTYEVFEAQTGYLWRCKVHAEREVASESEMVVLEILKSLENKGHTIWMDDYYNSPALARVLKSLGFDCVGTLRTNRQCPPQLLTIDKNMAIGQISGLTSGDIDVMVWLDRKRVALLSTYHGVAVYTSGGKSIPNAINDYNVVMGRVDKKNQMLSSFPLERKRNRTWYKILFRQLLNVSVLNALILHRRSSVPETHPHVTNHRMFRKTLISQLLARHSHPVSNAGRVHKSIFTSEVLQHFPMEYGFIPHPSKKERIRRSCVQCHKRVQTYCRACNVALCPVECIRLYHKGK